MRGTQGLDRGSMFMKPGEEQASDRPWLLQRKPNSALRKGPVASSWVLINSWSETTGLTLIVCFIFKSTSSKKYVVKVGGKSHLPKRYVSSASMHQHRTSLNLPGN